MNDTEIRKLLTSRHNDVDNLTIMAMVTVIADLEDGEVVALMRCCAVYLARKLVGDGAATVSHEIRRESVREVFELVLSTLDT